MNEAKIYFNKALKTCEDNKTTSTTWVFNFTKTYDLLKKKICPFETSLIRNLYFFTAYLSFFLFMFVQTISFL